MGQKSIMTLYHFTLREWIDTIKYELEKMERENNIITYRMLIADTSSLTEQQKIDMLHWVAAKKRQHILRYNRLEKELNHIYSLVTDE
jgi:hypothetical protein